LVAFMKKGGTILIMAGGEEVGRSGLLPFPLAFDSLPTRLGDASTLIRAADPKSQFLRWPNAITGKDFEDWSGERARGVPMGYDLRYRTVLSIGDADHTPTNGALLAAPVGRGMVIYSPLSLDRQLNAVNPGAARFFVNLLSAGLATTSK